MQGGSGWDDAVTPGKEKGAGPGARGGDAETPGGDGYHGGDAVGPGGAPGAPGYSPAYGRSPGFSPQGEPMGRDMPEVTAMAIADAIFDEIRNSGTEHKPPEGTQTLRPTRHIPDPNLKNPKEMNHERTRRVCVYTLTDITDSLPGSTS